MWSHCRCEGVPSRFNRLQYVLYAESSLCGESQQDHVLSLCAEEAARAALYLQGLPPEVRTERKGCWL